MGIGKDLSTNIKEWGILVMVIVVISVVLLKFRVNDSIVCSSGVLNETGSVNICCTGTANATASACQVANESVRTLYTDLNTYVSAFSEPKNWVIIVIIALIGISLLALFNKMKK